MGKKSLLRTLRTLGPVPEWKSSDHVQKSDSEAEDAPSARTKKKRRKKRKPAETSEEQHNSADQSVEGKPASTKKKKGSKAGQLDVVLQTDNSIFILLTSFFFEVLI